LAGVVMLGRTAIMLSQGDLTAGLAGLKTWEIHGYTAEAARQVMFNALTSLSPGQKAEVGAGRAGVDVKPVSGPVQ
jgi:hypothetical protein